MLTVRRDLLRRWRHVTRRPIVFLSLRITLSEEFVGGLLQVSWLSGTEEVAKELRIGIGKDSRKLGDGFIELGLSLFTRRKMSAQVA